MATFKDGVTTLNDLKTGMILEGVVTNITDFGAFVDIGVHQDGLVHKSAISQQFVKDPREVVKIGNIVTVKVVEVDLDRKRINLSMRMGDDRADKASVGFLRIKEDRVNGDQAKNTPERKRHSSPQKKIAHGKVTLDKTMHHKTSYDKSVQDKRAGDKAANQKTRREKIVHDNTLNNKTADDNKEQNIKSHDKALTSKTTQHKDFRKKRAENKSQHTKRFDKNKLQNKKLFYQSSNTEIPSAFAEALAKALKTEPK